MNLTQFKIIYNLPGCGLDFDGLLGKGWAFWIFCRKLKLGICMFLVDFINQKVGSKCFFQDHFGVVMQHCFF